MNKKPCFINVNPNHFSQVGIELQQAMPPAAILYALMIRKNCGG